MQNEEIQISCFSKSPSTLEIICRYGKKSCANMRRCAFPVWRILWQIPKSENIFFWKPPGPPMFDSLTLNLQLVLSKSKSRQTWVHLMQNQEIQISCFSKSPWNLGIIYRYCKKSCVPQRDVFYDRSLKGKSLFFFKPLMFDRGPGKYRIFPNLHQNSELFIGMVNSK